MVRARAAARGPWRGPARSIQPGHIEFGTGNWSLRECFAAEIAIGNVTHAARRSIDRATQEAATHRAAWRSRYLLDCSTSCR